MPLAIISALRRLLRSRNRRRRLEVVHLEGALEVEDRHLVGLRNIEEGAKGAVRVDVLTGHETLLTSIANDGTSDLAAAELGALGLTQEDTECIRDVVQLREHVGLVGGRGAIGTDRRLAATTLVELLGGADDLTLLLLVLRLDRLDKGKNGRDLLTKGLVGREKRGAILDRLRGRGNGGRNCGMNRCSGGYNRSYNRSRGGGGSGSRGRHLLGSRLLCGGRGAGHFSYDSSVGYFREIQTHVGGMIV